MSATGPSLFSGKTPDQSGQLNGTRQQSATSRAQRVPQKGNSLRGRKVVKKEASPGKVRFAPPTGRDHPYDSTRHVPRQTKKVEETKFKPVVSQISFSIEKGVFHFKCQRTQGKSSTTIDICDYNAAPAQGRFAGQFCGTRRWSESFGSMDDSGFFSPTGYLIQGTRTWQVGKEGFHSAGDLHSGTFSLEPPLQSIKKEDVAEIPLQHFQHLANSHLVQGSKWLVQEQITIEGHFRSDGTLIWEHPSPLDLEKERLIEARGSLDPSTRLTFQGKLQAWQKAVAPFGFPPCQTFADCEKQYKQLSFRRTPENVERSWECLEASLKEAVSYSFGKTMEDLYYEINRNPTETLF